ncbi:MAG: DUF72 domain-containing protein [Phycisphaerae bacterium]
MTEPTTQPAPHDRRKYRIGTSGYSFLDWVGPFYPPGTKRSEMFGSYVQAFQTVELNFSFYRMPSPKTLERMARMSPPGFDFWVKANQQITHEGRPETAGEFLQRIGPIVSAGKLAGVLLQFPQSFHRTVANRRYLADVLEHMAKVPLAVEFRHFTWDHRSTYSGLGDRGVSLVIPDVPQIASLHRPRAMATAPVGYLRLHSRNADLWYAGAVERYDYDYSRSELEQLLEEWSQVEQESDRIYTFFNNCHRGQAAENARQFERILEKIQEQDLA